MMRTDNIKRIDVAKWFHVLYTKGHNTDDFL